MWMVAITTLMLAQSPALGEAAASKLPPGVRRIVAPRDAALAAWLDLSANVPQPRQPYQWYVWNNTGPGNAGTIESAAALNFLANAILSQAGKIVDPTL